MSIKTNAMSSVSRKFRNEGQRKPKHTHTHTQTIIMNNHLLKQPLKKHHENTLNQMSREIKLRSPATSWAGRLCTRGNTESKRDDAQELSRACLVVSVLREVLSLGS